MGRVRGGRGLRVQGLSTWLSRGPAHPAARGRALGQGQGQWGQGRGEPQAAGVAVAARPEARVGPWSPGTVLVYVASARPAFARSAVPGIPDTSPPSGAPVCPGHGPKHRAGSAGRPAGERTPQPPGAALDGAGSPLSCPRCSGSPRLSAAVLELKQTLASALMKQGTPRVDRDSTACVAAVPCPLSAHPGWEGATRCGSCRPRS